MFKKCSKFFYELAGVSNIEVARSFDLVSSQNQRSFVKVVTDSARLFIDLSGAVDVDKERERLTRECEKFENEVKFYENKLSDEQFLAKAPEKVLNLQRSKLEAAKLKLQKAIQSLSEI